jgi:hypothetical protein
MNGPDAAPSAAKCDGAPRPLIRVVTVHGTGDTSAEREGSKWYQIGSDFMTRLAEQLSALGYDLECIPFLWDGANSALARARAAAALQRELDAASRRGWVHVIGHSHGGNVANDAACRIAWREGRRRRKLASLITVGTPFLRTKVDAVEAGLKWAFAFVVLLGGLSALFASVTAHWSYWPFLAAILLAVPVAYRGLLRMRRARQPKRAYPEITAIRHPNDEAIAFLQHVENLDIKPFPRGSLGRATMPSAEFLGLVVTLLAAIYFAPGALEIARENSVAGSVDFYWTAIVLDTMYSASSFVLAYFAVRLVSLAALDWLSRGWINRTIAGVLKGLALGRDGGIKVGDTSPYSHYYGTQEIILDGDLAQRMSSNSADSTRRLFEKYRSSLFSFGADASNAVIEMARDAMTWDSLIHTTYFDQPEVAEMIAQQIVARERP